MFYTIYQVTHVPTGKNYVGKHQTTNLDDNYMGSGNLIRRAIKKYGLDQFEKKILHVFDNEEDMNSKEAELVTEEFCKRQDTYNICPGGKGGWGYVNTNDLGNVGWKTNGSLKAKEASLKGALTANKRYPKNHFSGKRCDWVGKSHFEETKAKIGAANSKHQTGNKNSQYGTMWITNGIESKKIKVDQEIPVGYRRGR